MLRVFAIVDPACGAVPGARVVSLGSVGAVVDEVADSPAPSAEAAVEFDRVIRSIAEQSRAVLPARFGTVFADEAALAKAIDAKKSELEKALELVSGRVQMTLRLSGSPDAPQIIDDSGNGPGARYLREKLRAHVAAKTVAELDPVRPSLAPFVFAERADRVPGRAWFASVYHLIPRGAVADYSAAIESVRPVLAARDIALSVSGPWAPYAFAPEPAG